MNGNGKPANGAGKHVDSLDEKNSLRAQEIQQNIGVLASRDLQLMSICLLMLLVLSAGFITLIYPNLATSVPSSRTEMRMLPQLFFGLITLIILFNLYVLFQKRDLNSTRRRLVEELIFNERMQAVSLVDPATQLYNRRAMEQMLAREVARVNRMDSSLSLMILDIADFESFTNRLGTQEMDHFLYEAAQLVRNTLRGSDMVFRYSESQFLAVLPDTTEQQAECAVKRLQTEIERHNAELRCNVDLVFNIGLSQYAHGSRIVDTLQNAQRRAFLQKHNFVPVF